MDVPFSCLSLSLSLSSVGGDTGRGGGQAVSCRMFLVIVLLLLPQARAFVANSYNGFDACGENGWICEKIFPASEITFDCTLSRSPNARLWIWTARLPSRVKTVTAQNCSHLELHVDCTRGHRETKIEKFQLINIQELTLLKTSNTYEFLHDNSPIPHLPPYFHMENIGRVSFYKGLFQGQHKSCNYNSGTMRKMVMKNVYVENVEQGAFESELDEIVWSKVMFKKIEPGAMTINGTNLIVENSSISEIQNKAMSFKANKVSLSWNQFAMIGVNSIIVYSYTFDFLRNKVKDIMSSGLNVRSSHVNFEGNIIGELSKEALGAISPAYYITDDNPITFTITYTFTGNEIHFMNRFSLHPDWKAYGDHPCSKVVIDSNKFNCNCENLFWMRSSTDASLPDVAGFYKLLLNTTHHCNTSSNCSLSAIIPYVCRNETSIEIQCAGVKEKETFDELNVTEAYIMPPGPEGDSGSEGSDTLEWDGSYSERGNPDTILDKSYYTDKSYSEASGISAYLWVAIVAAVLIKSLCVLAAFTWYIKRKKRYQIAEIYKYDKTNDSDNLITQERSERSNELENPLFHHE